MPLPAPNLDDRKFQDLVDEAKRRIPLYCPEWTDHNVSDPGVALIELFAWMSEMVIYRLNRVPERHYVKFLEMLGVTLNPGQAATTKLTFTLSSQQPHAVVIPKATEVATLRTESDEAIVFSTQETLKIVVPQLKHVLIRWINPTTGQPDRFYEASNFIREQGAISAAMLGLPETAEEGQEETNFAAFRIDDPKKGPDPGNSVYFGFENNIESNLIILRLECAAIGGTGIDPTRPPLEWQYRRESDGQWRPMDLAYDTTGGLNITGEVGLHVPSDIGRTEVDLKTGYWLRVRTMEAPANYHYRESPRISGVSGEARGGTVSAIHATLEADEILGVSSGKPGQFFKVHNMPILPFTSSEEVLEVEADDIPGTWDRWEPVVSFADSQPNSLNYLVDYVSGEILFGPSIGQQDGSERQYGKVPEKGKQVRITYRHGGGVSGNLRENMLTQLKTSIPYVASVTNRYPATGGTDPEELEDAKIKGQKMLRIQERAIVQEDYEELAKRSSSSVHRAICVPTRPAGDGVDLTVNPPPGVVQLLVIPKVPNPASLIPPEHLVLSEKIKEDIQRELFRRMPLGVYLNVGTPTYKSVCVITRISVHPLYDPEAVVAAVEEKLYRYVNPVIGGPEGTGLPIGRELRLPEIYAVIHSVEGVQFAANVELCQVNADGTRSEPEPMIRVSDDMAICSAKHEVSLWVDA